MGPKGLECGSWSPRPSPGGELCFSGLRGGLTHAWGPGAAPARGLARTWVSISISFVPRVGHLMVCPFQTHTLSPFKDRNRTGSPACRAMCVVGLSRLLSPPRPILVGTFSVDTPASVTPWNPGVLAVPHSSGAWTGVVLRAVWVAVFWYPADSQQNSIIPGLDRPSVTAPFWGTGGRGRGATGMLGSAAQTPAIYSHEFIRERFVCS